MSGANDVVSDVFCMSTVPETLSIPAREKDLEFTVIRFCFGDE